MHAVVLADAALARVVRKAAFFCALVQRQDGVGRQRAKAHGRDVEHARVVGLGAGRHRLRRRIGAAADPHAKVVRRQLRGRERVVHPFIPLRAHVQVRAEGAVVRVALGALVDQRALRARERRGLAIAFDEILAHLGPHIFEHEADVADDRVVAQNGVARLLQVVHAQGHQRRKHQHHGQPHAKRHQRKQRQQQPEHAQRKGRVAHRVQGVQLVDHGGPGSGRWRGRATLTAFLSGCHVARGSFFTPWPCLGRLASAADERHSTRPAHHKSKTSPHCPHCPRFLA